MEVKVLFLYYNVSFIMYMKYMISDGINIYLQVREISNLEIIKWIQLKHLFFIYCWDPSEKLIFIYH